MNTDLKNEAQNDFWVTVKLVGELFSEDGMRRHNARLGLEQEGQKATPLLIGALKSKNTDVRWEAAKALIKIKDPLAADALTDTLMDEDYEVRWLAAEALIALGRDAIEPVLRKLLGHYDSTFLRTGAHHVLENLKRNEILKNIEEISYKIFPLENSSPRHVADLLDRLIQEKSTNPN